MPNEKPVVVAEKGPETDPVVKREEEIFQASLREIAEDLDRILVETGWIVEGEKVSSTETLGQSMEKFSEKVRDYSSVLELRGRLKNLAEKYAKKLKSGKKSSQALFGQGWAWYWAGVLSKNMDNLPEEIQGVIKRMAASKKLNPNDHKKLLNWVKLEHGDGLKEYEASSEKEIRQYQERIGSHRIARERVYSEKLEELSLMKGGVMWRLKKNLRDIDNKKEHPPEELKERKKVSYDESSNTLYVRDRAGQRQEITFGDLVGDYDWGIKYAPDASVPPKIWRKIRKTLALYEARDKIRGHFNNELSIRYNVGVPGVAYDLKRIEWEMEKSVGAVGFLAERMITEFLIRIQYNNPELGLRVESSNVLEDALLKYDFKIELKRKRGLALEPVDVSREDYVADKRKLGVQFTISKKKPTTMIEVAKSRLEDFEELLRGKVDDVVIVGIPELKKIRELYGRWKSEGKPSGGPEQYMSREEKLAIFKKATEGLLDLSEKELANLKI